MVFIPSATIHKPGGLSSLAGVVASCIFDLDATISASYDGSGQTWANLVAAPADGTAQTDYDFYLGATSSATTDDPTFNGSAGSSSAYFSFDGGDRFSIKSGSNTSFLNSLHKTTGGSDWTCVAALYTNNVTAANPVINTQGTTSGVGLRCYINASENMNHTQRTGGATSSVDSSPTAIAIDTPVIAAFAHSHGTNKTKFWVNTATGVEVSHTYGTTTANASLPMTIGWMPNSQPAENGMRLYAVSMFNAYLSDGNIASVIAAYNSRHGRTYV